MIHVTIEYNGKTYVVGDFDDVIIGFNTADEVAKKRGWKRYKKIFEEIDFEETIDL
ncbi:MAG: hypothetical protein PHU71_05110 [Candidatus Gracilibacteria bacterium]|nr:hypothetical protein [Candidatus Gracilibacteria bacterium]